LKQSSIGSRASLARRLRELSEAEAAIEQGIHVVRRQNAKSLESRGAMSLARQRRRQGKPQGAARNAVSPWEAGAPRSAASRWEAAANPWLGAIARCSRTGSSNPSPSSGESGELQTMSAAPASLVDHIKEHKKEAAIREGYSVLFVTA